MAPAGHEGITGITFDSDGHRLVGVAYFARGHHPKPTALLLHCFAGLEQNLYVAAVLRDSGWNAVVFHYRGCWGSAGRYDLRTIGRAVRAAVDHLKAGRYPGVDPDRIAVVGHSLGGWAAILAAAADQRLRAVVTCAAPAELGSARIPPGEVDREFTRLLATTPAEFLSQLDDVVASISPRPLLVIHGSDDEWIRADQGRLLYERAAEPRRYAEIEGANHAFAWHRTPLLEEIIGWLAEIDLSAPAGACGGPDQTDALGGAP